MRSSLTILDYSKNKSEEIENKKRKVTVKEDSMMDIGGQERASLF